jgi:RNA polymerase sigma-70 factor (ECF subfamily)
MSEAQNEFEKLMQRVRDGDAEAGRELFERYGKAIQMVVRHRLDRRLRSQFDSLDFAQDAWASFFDTPAENHTFQTSEELVAFLTRVVRHKLIDAYRQRFHTARRDAGPVPDEPLDLSEQPARQPTPSQVAIAEEEWDRLLHNKPPKVRRALEMLRAGHSRQEIAESLGINAKRIQRLIQRMDDKKL